MKPSGNCEVVPVGPGDPDMRYVARCVKCNYESYEYSSREQALYLMQLHNDKRSHKTNRAPTRFAV